MGLGYATPVVVGSRVYAFTRRGDAEVLAAFDADTGKEIWQASYPAPYTLVRAATVHGLGPKSTPVYADGRLFTLGISGVLSAFEATTGKLLWQKPAPAIGPFYSTAQSPLVDRGLLIVHVGGVNQGALTAFDAATGQPKWQWTGDGPAYGSPIIAELAGVRQVVTLTQQNLVGVSAATGELLWRRPFKTPNDVNEQTPIVYGQMLIVAGREQGFQSLRLTREGSQVVVEEVWQSPDIWPYLTNSVIVRDAIFGLSVQNRGQFFFMDARTGKVLWTGEPRAAENAAIVQAGHLLFILEDDGELVVADGSDPTRLLPIQRYKVSDQPTWAQPAISGNRVFVKDLTTLALLTLN